MHLRVYNYNTLERVNQFEAHSDYLRSIAIHPTQPYILSSSGKLVKTYTLGVMQERERMNEKLTKEILSSFVWGAVVA